MWELDHKEDWALCFWTVVLGKTLESLLDCRRSSQSILKEINLEYSLKGLMLKLKLQYLGHVMRRTNSLEKIQMLGKIEGKRKRGWQRMRWFDSITDSTSWVWANSERGWIAREPGVLQAMGSQSQTWLSDWTELAHLLCTLFLLLLHQLHLRSSRIKSQRLGIPDLQGAGNGWK